MFFCPVLNQMIELLDVNHHIRKENREDTASSASRGKKEKREELVPGTSHGMKRHDANLGTSRETVVEVEPIVVPLRFMDIVNNYAPSKEIAEYVARVSHMWNKVEIITVQVDNMDRFSAIEFRELFDEEILPDTTKLNYYVTHKSNVYALSATGEVFLTFVDEGVIASYTSKITKKSVMMYFCVNDDDSE